MSDTTLKLECNRHGNNHATFICHHLLSGIGKGFVVANDPEDPRPDAWCIECDNVLMEEGEWNDKSEAYADVKIVCANCYDEIRRRNIVWEDSEGKTERKWLLQSALDTHHTYPDTFHLPPAEVRANLEPDDYVKLIFLLPAVDDEGEYFQGERMWVSVTEVDEIGYWGVLDSDPVTKGSINSGDVVLFGPEHVIDVRKQAGSEPSNGKLGPAG